MARQIKKRSRHGGIRKKKSRNRQGSDKLDSRFTLIRFWFEIESINDSQLTDHDLPTIYFWFDLIFDSQVNHDSRVNRDSRRIKIKPNQKE